MQTIIFHNKKGGVGKSSATINFATALAALGFQVAIIDGDEQANSTSLALPRRQFTLTLTDVITRQEEERHTKTLQQAMVQVRKRLWVVPADMELGGSQVFIRKANDFDILADRIEELRRDLAPTPPAERLPWWGLPAVPAGAFSIEPTTEREFVTPPAFLDFLFFDSPPNEDELTISMLYASDKVIIPTELEEFAFQGIAQLIERIKRRFRHRVKKIALGGILPNKVLHRPNHSMPVEYLESLLRHFPTMTLRPVHFDPVVSESQGYHLTTLELKSDARAVREFGKLALDLAGYQGALVGLPICEICGAAARRVFPQESAG